ncbi:hypothetical protein [Herbaspirillum robiniae]|uniref:Uncharacterized protein n=1 Tax=Herbaspirillum robiniae TaxID=2014887 RepID=A0ABX2LUH8_9BURK|nr:hypothetical protein [Herbaspirillum robiniae]NUU01695.1 hypothetical protein [Herbaspirillum robiniae]
MTAKEHPYMPNKPLYPTSGNELADRKRLALFSAVLLVSVVQIAMHLIASLQLYFWMILSIFSPAARPATWQGSWTVLLPFLLGPVVWAYWFSLSILWIYHAPARRITVLTGTVLAFLSLICLGKGGALVLPAVLFACYICYWHWLSSAEHSVRFPER